jgi:hypothetical protein
MDPKLQESLEAKQAIDFIKSLPPDHYKHIRKPGEVQGVTQLDTDLKAA